METLKTLATETYNYKGLEVKRVDTIEQSQNWTLGAFPKRTWFINGNPAHTKEIKGVVLLAYYNEGTPVALSEFNPECGFYIELTSEIENEINSLGKSLEHTVKTY